MNRSEILKFVIDNYKEGFYKSFPIRNSTIVDSMFEKSCRDIGLKGFTSAVDFIKDLNFPLEVYRGLRIRDKDNLNLNDAGVNWTIDDKLFQEKSSFKDCNCILKTKVTEDEIDFPETIVNYFHYSYKLKERTGKYPENEVVLKESPKEQEIEIIKLN